MREHYLNSTQVLAEAWSVADNALKIIPAANTQFAVSLDAADGDNVRTIPNSISISESDGAVSCVGMKTVCLYGVGAITVSPSDEGEDFFALSATELVPLAICARRIKITGAGKAVVQAV
jgi:hypothetical protein